MSSVELAMGKLIQLYLVCVGEFWVRMQSNAKKKKKKKKKKDTDSDQTLYSVLSAELPQNVVKVKFGQIHLNEVFVGEFLQSLDYRFTCSYMQNKTNTMLYILTFHACYRLQWRQFAGKIKALSVGKIWKMFRCVPPYFYVPVTELSYEGKKLHLWKI